MGRSQNTPKSCSTRVHGADWKVGLQFKYFKFFSRMVGLIMRLLYVAVVTSLSSPLRRLPKMNLGKGINVNNKTWVCTAQIPLWRETCLPANGVLVAYHFLLYWSWLKKSPPVPSLGVILTGSSLEGWPKHGQVSIGVWLLSLPNFPSFCPLAVVNPEDEICTPKSVSVIGTNCALPKFVYWSPHSQYFRLELRFWDSIFI